MSLIIEFEHASGGGEAHCCPRETQDIDSINLKIERELGGPGSIQRIRLCNDCALRLRHELNRMLKESPK